MNSGVTKLPNHGTGVTKPANQWPEVNKPANQKPGQMKAANQKNAYLPVRIDPDSDYVTPGVFELQQLFWTEGGAELAHVNEVWPRLFIGDEKTSLERPQLEAMGMTHVLNAAEGKWNNVATGPAYYRGMNVQYYGITAEDTPTFDLTPFFYPAADFIHQALSQPESRVLVHCVRGRSRSAALVLAYLMLQERLSVVEAVTLVRRRRCVLPNRGFIKQLRTLDITLQQHRRQHRDNHTAQGGEEVNERTGRRGEERENTGRRGEPHNMGRRGGEREDRGRRGGEEREDRGRRGGEGEQGGEEEKERTRGGEEEKNERTEGGQGERNEERGRTGGGEEREDRGRRMRGQRNERRRMRDQSEDRRRRGMREEREEGERNERTQS
ncbi:hypothetical protein ACEWY4_020835 [Coilia grayii]|uniref:Dual specificity phosphatase 29 n=1 Tax=Coilia grayii TaxID=363190 RepID=A0ABD1J796_9TELE